MKNIDWKKIAIVAVIAILLVLSLVLVIKNSNKEKEATEEETKILEELTNKYIKRLTIGHANNYLGMDILFKEKETKYDDLTTGDILNTAINYIKENEQYVITYELKTTLEVNGYNADDFISIISGEQVRDAIKELFNVEWEDKESIEADGEYYSYYYDEDLDLYLQEINNKYNEIDIYNISTIYTKTIKATKTKDKATITIAVAYVNDDEKQVFYSDVDQEKVVYSNDEYKETIDDDHTDDFDKYTITYKVDGDKYYFESIKKD